MLFIDSGIGGARVPSSYTVGPRFEALIKGLVESGRYTTASEVVREGLRLLEDREQLRNVRIAELHRLAEEGRLSGISDEDGEAFLDRLEAKYRPSEAHD
jgi:antitoxin ParD1/3/4